MNDELHRSHLIIDLCLRASAPGTSSEDRSDYAYQAALIDPSMTIGCLLGIATGLLEAIDVRTHGLVSVADVWGEMNTAIRCRMDAEAAEAGQP